VTGRVDARALMVRDGAAGIGFEVDCGAAKATLDPGGEPHRLRVLSWSEKGSLARFTDAGAAFIEEQFVAICGDGTVPQDPARRAAATALALWLHGPLALPLDPPLLGEVTIRLCAELGVGPAELAALPAPEVEALWHSLRAGPTDAGALDGDGPTAADGVTRILIQPDPSERVEPPLQAAQSPDPEAWVPTSEAAGPLDGASAAVEAEAAPARPGVPAPAGPRPAEPAGSAGRAESVRASRGSTPASAPRPAEAAGSGEQERAAPQPGGTKAAATATGGEGGVEAASEAAKSALRSGMMLDAAADDVPRALSPTAAPVASPASQGRRPGARPRRPTGTLTRGSERLAATPAIPSESGRSNVAGAASGALQSPSGSPPQPLARFRLVPAKEAESDVPDPCVGDGPMPAGRSGSERARHGAPSAPRSAATAAPLRAFPDRPPPGTWRLGQIRRTAHAGPAGPDHISAWPADPRVRPTEFAGPDPVSPRLPEASPPRREPAGGGRRRAAPRVKSAMPRHAAPPGGLTPLPAPEAEAAMAIDSRLRTLIDIVSRVPEGRSDGDRNPEAMFDDFAERLAEAASELGLGDGV
jgi:hypothetical protein